MSSNVSCFIQYVAYLHPLIDKKFFYQPPMTGNTYYKHVNYPEKRRKTNIKSSDYEVEQLTRFDGDDFGIV